MWGFLFFCVVSFAASFDSSHQLWGQVLHDVVTSEGSSTKVRYEKIVKDPSKLNEYLLKVSSVSKEEYDKWEEAERLAFLINAYNAFTLQFVAQGLKDNPNLESIKDLGSLFQSPWKKKFFSILGEKSHLDHIEHNLARPNFDEPRLHFAFNCASIGCPALNETPFTGKNLSEQLEGAARRFLQDESRNRWNAAKGQLEVSSIFKWYGDDFEKSKKMSPLYSFLVQRLKLTDEQRKNLSQQKAKITYLSYDWALNRALQ